MITATWAFDMRMYWTGLQIRGALITGPGESCSGISGRAWCV